jgi:mono/diheme cytochrome c family protein
MARALAAILVLAGIALGAWALLAANQKTELAAPTTEVAPEASTDTAANEAPASGDTKPAGGDTATAPAGEQKGAAPEQKTAGTEPKSSAGGAGASGNPEEVAKSAEKGSLKSPISDPKGAAEQGHKIFMSAGCNGCHGGTGGGGMGPPLTNEIWVYGSDDDTLFRLIALGSDGLKAQGFNRKGSENVVGPMPPHGKIVKSSEDLWKIIAWIRSINPSSGKTAAGGGGGGGASPATGGAAPGGAAAQSAPADQ